MKKSILKDYDFVGILSDDIKSYVAEKRAVGCKFNTESKKLCEFSKITLDYSFESHTLPKDVVEFWISRRPNESDKSLYNRFGIIKGFADYMLRMGNKAYLPILGDIPKMHWHTYSPYIFSHEEILKFFNKIDSMMKPKYSNSHRRHIIMPVVFRLLYCCGLRVNEALSLTIEDIDFENDVLIIKDAKFDKSRYVPMSEEISAILKKYIANNIHEPFLFPSIDYGKYHDKTVYGVFREVIFAIGIPHGGRGKGPRVHDFRHTFAVHCLQKWISSGHPLNNALPRLSTYLGHNDIVATEKYLRMTAEVYPEIAKKLSAEYGHLIPKETVQNENDRFCGLFD